MMRSIIGVQDSTVLINMEDVSVETLELFVQQLDFARVLFLLHTRGRLLATSAVRK